MKIVYSCTHRMVIFILCLIGVSNCQSDTQENGKFREISLFKGSLVTFLPIHWKQIDSSLSTEYHPPSKYFEYYFIGNKDSSTFCHISLLAFEESIPVSLNKKVESEAKNLINTSQIAPNLRKEIIIASNKRIPVLLYKSIVIHKEGNCSESIFIDRQGHILKYEICSSKENIDSLTRQIIGKTKFDDTLYIPNGEEPYSARR